MQQKKTSLNLVYKMVRSSIDVRNVIVLNRNELTIVGEWNLGQGHC